MTGSAPRRILWPMPLGRTPAPRISFQERDRKKNILNINAFWPQIRIALPNKLGRIIKHQIKKI